MDKNAIKKYAVWARREMIARVSTRAAQYGITADGCGDPDAASVQGRLLSREEKAQRTALIAQIREKGYEQVMEEAAYTWFNRFAALRFMEVNGYLPSHVRVFTNDTGEFRPQILTEAINLELEGLDMQRVYDLKNANDDGTLFKYLLIVQCNALNGILPGMFQKIDDYTELLLPDNLLREGSVIEQMVTAIPEEDWTDQVQIIGWLYQYYISEKKDKVFEDLKKNVKITKENIPAATQLFTPDWIVHYMVENSLGRLWLEGHPNDALRSEWKYYLDEAEQEPEVQAQLAELRKGYAALTPEDIRVIDPCCGSGHILCVLFDVLVRIYEDYGYTAREAVSRILENNLFGLDIDPRAAQLSYFSVMMKARQYDRRFFSRKDAYGRPDVPTPRVFPVIPSSRLDPAMVRAFADDANELFQDDRPIADNTARLIEQMRDADEYGSILTVRDVDYSVLYSRYDLLVGGERPSAVDLLVKEQFLPFLRAAEMLSRQYDAVVTNPPYMGSSGMGPKLTDFVKKNYPDSKSDLFAVFIERCGEMTAENGYQAMITQHAWMFLSSFEKLRGKQQAVDTVNMAHLGARAFEEIGGEVVQTTSFVLRNTHIRAYKGTYCRLIEPTSQQGKEDMFLAGENRYAAQQDNFAKIPGAPVAYWASEAVQTAFSKYPQIDDVFETRNGMSTTNNGIFLRFWYEPALPTIGLGNYTAISAKDSGKRWFRYNKGGEFRRWYGNNDFVVNWYADGKELKEYVAERYGSYSKEIRSEDRYFYESITWSGVTSGQTGFRYSPQGAVFDSGANGLFANNHQLLMYLMGFLNTKIVVDFVKYKNPTINTGSGTVGKLPINIDYSIIDLVEEIVQRCITLSKTDWDAFETSWDFQRHPLVTYRVPEPVWGDVPDEVAWKTINLGLTFHCWEDVCQVRFDKLKANEEELNRIFIDIYGLQDELTPEVDDRDVTVRRADLGRDIRSLISYAVGCMFGRYSLNKEGLVYAGGDFNDVYWLYKGKAAIDKDGNTDGYPGISMAKYHYPRLRDSDDWETATQLDFEPDYDNVIPICDDEYFDDDIVSRFVKFVETVYGKNSLEENLNFIARALGGKGSAREVIRRYFLNDFYADHLKIYQNRPIYWLFDSGKKNGFKCLIYMHRYRPDTIARIRTDYVHEQQSRYRTAIADLEQRIAAASTADRVKLSKQLSKLQAQAEEIRVYEEKIHHLADQMISIDLDDGVKVNYAKFADVLAKIK